MDKERTLPRNMAVRREGLYPVGDPGLKLRFFDSSKVPVKVKLKTFTNEFTLPFFVIFSIVCSGFLCLTSGESKYSSSGLMLSSHDIVNRDYMHT